MRRRALLICNSIYPEDPASFPALNGPQADGLLLWRALSDQSVGLFRSADIGVMYERDHADVLKNIESFFTAARPTDDVLFYFSGHARPAGGTLYLCVRNTSAKNLRSTAVSADEISKMIDESHARSIVIILDCCYSGAFKGGDADAALAGLKGTGRYVITATTHVDPAPDATDPGHASPFTEILVDCLTRDLSASDTGSNLITLDDLFTAIVGQAEKAKLPEPRRQFDGTGEIAIRYAGPSDQSDTASLELQAPSAPQVWRQDSGISTRWAPHFRARGDLSASDFRLWIPDTALSLSSLISCSYVIFGVIYAAGFPHGGLSEVVRIQGFAALALSLLWLALSGIEAYVTRDWLRGAASRRELMLRSESRPAMRVRQAKVALSLLSALLLISPVTGIGLLDWQWVLSLACLAGLVVLTGAEWLHLGDACVLCGALLLTAGNFIPLYLDNLGGGGEFATGVQGGAGIFRALLGILVMLAWVGRLPSGVLAGLTLIAALLLPGAAFEHSGSGWIICAVGVGIIAIGLLLGASAAPMDDLERVKPRTG